MNSPPAGLSETEAARRREADGPNDVVPAARGTHARRFLGPLLDPMVALLLVAAPTYLLIGDTTDAIVAFIALVPVAGVGWALESHAERTLDRLASLTAPVATVIRDGRERRVATRNLVVGDLIRVIEGDVIPADAHILDLTQLSTDESSLTGESLPMDKFDDAHAQGDENRRVWAGTTVVSGRALARITAIGSQTRYGHIARLVSSERPSRTPLQASLARLVGALALLALVFCAAVMVAELAHGHGWGEAVIAGVSLAIAAIPEEFSMVYTLYLALGAWRLAQDRALVRRLPSVETLGSTTVICADKTGTLTEGHLRTAAIWTASNGVESIGGTNLSPAGRTLLRAATLACEPEPFDPLDLAIIATARHHGVDVDRLHTARLVADWPFDATDRYITHAWIDQADAEERTVAAKGAIEGILAHCHPIDGDAGTTTRAVTSANIGFTSSGMRVIAVASGRAPLTSRERAEDEAGLSLLGLIAFDDPIRPGVADALAECRAAGVRVVMITGDHPATAHVVAEGLGLPHECDGDDLIAVGDDLDIEDEVRVAALVARANVFARTRPEHKHRLVEELRRQGHVVAMTGDGINDAPALRHADIGVAMGERGTEVARAAASIVLLDDNFSTIVRAVRDGRRIFDNLTRACAYLIAFHPPLLLSALVVPLLGKPLLLLPIHFVMLELLLHPIVSLVFQADPPSADTMRRPPRPVGDALRPRSLVRPYLMGTAIAAADIATYLVALSIAPEDEARAVAFAALLAVQPFLLLSARSTTPFRRTDRPWTRTLRIVLTVLVPLVPAVVYVRPLADLLHLAPFAPLWWCVVAVTAAIPALFDLVTTPSRVPTSPHSEPDAPEPTGH